MAELPKYQKSFDLLIKRLPFAGYCVIFQSIYYYNQQSLTKNPFPLDLILIRKSIQQKEGLFCYVRQCWLECNFALDFFKCLFLSEPCVSCPSDFLPSICPPVRCQELSLQVRILLELRAKRAFNSWPIIYIDR